MPIYAYRCSTCGHAKDVLRKISDPLLTTCPACGAETFSKQVTAAGFQLKGSGWYATDFRGGTPPATAVAPAAPDAPAAAPSTGGTDTAASSASSASGSGGTACGGSCACH